MQTEWLAHQIGTLQTTVSVGIDGIHRRLDYQDQQDREWRRYMLRKLDKPRNGNGHRIPYGKLCAIGILLLIGIASKAYPEATKKASLELVERLLLGAVKN